jgi:hypothetical protein
MSVSIWVLILSIVDNLDLLSLRRSSLPCMSSFFSRSRLDVWLRLDELTWDQKGGSTVGVPRAQSSSDSA